MAEKNGIAPCYTMPIRVATGCCHCGARMYPSQNTLVICRGKILRFLSCKSANVICSRHNQYIQESTGITDVGFTTAVHDLKLLLNRFAQEKSFADESGGGGRSSNIHLIPYLTQLALYVMISSNQNQSHVKALHTYFAQRPSDWVGLAYEVWNWIFGSLIFFFFESKSFRVTVTCIIAF